MKSWLKPFAVVALVVAAASPAFANIAPAQPGTGGRSKPGKSVSARMQLRPDAKAKEAKLIIPRAVLQQLRAELDGDGGGTNAAASVAPSGFNLTPTQTAFAGLCLSLSLVFGGVWFVNSRAAGKRTARVAASVAVVALLGAAAAGAVVYGNAGPPAYARSLNSKILVPETTYYGGPYGNVKVEITDESGDYIELRLPKWNGKEGD